MEWVEGKFIILNVITFCVITFRVTEFYYILRQKLLHFALTSLLHLVVYRRNYAPDFQFPLRNNVKISEHASNFNVFKPRLVCRRIFILPSGSIGKKFQIFHQSPHTLNLVIGLKFRKI